MATEDFTVSISPDPVEVAERAWGVDRDLGADLRFLGIVRDREDGKLILGIDYTHYPGLAEKTLAEICHGLLEKGPAHRALIHHRVGFVEAGTASLVIRVRTPHSAAAFDLAREYLRRIKETVPVWKRAVPASGEAGREEARR
jgi:molybdopterin synthase catalytic subunit